MVDANLSTKVEITLSCEHLPNKDTFSKSDPMCVLSMRRAGHKSSFDEVGRTETIKDNLNPVFKKTVKVEYFFEERQDVRIDCYDVDSQSMDLSKHDYLGNVEFTMAELVASLGQTLKLPMKDKKGVPLHNKKARITIKCEELKESNESVKFVVSGVKLDKKDLFGKSDPYLEFYRVRPDDNSQTLVHKTDYIPNTLDPKWPLLTFKAQALCNGEHARPIVVKCFDWSKHSKPDYIGECQFTLQELVEKKKTDFVLHRADKKDQQKPHGTLVFSQVELIKEFSFLDYIRGGMQISLMVAIDFTGSNGDPQSPESLHYRFGTVPNEYVQAITTIGHIVAPYASRPYFPVWGFGAKLPTGAVSHCFPLTFDQDRVEVHGVEGILSAYQASLDKVLLSGPTYFQEVLGMAEVLSSTAFTKSEQHYHILLIITDGVINDMNATVQRIISATDKPLSIIIVGVGNADFKLMDTLDADNKALEINGQKAKRDIVQFVPMNKFKSQHISALSKETLAEVPTQILEYTRMQKVVPNTPMQRMETFAGDGAGAGEYKSGPVPQYEGYDSYDKPPSGAPQYQSYDYAGAGAAAVPQYESYEYSASSAGTTSATVPQYQTSEPPKYQ